MKILPWDDFAARREPGPWAVTIGVFDGVHLGHQRLVKAVLESSKGRKTAAVTFRENPKKILRPSSFRGNIFDLEAKLEALAALGLDYCVLIDFSLNFGTLSGAEFLGILVGAGVSSIHVGPNFRCGHKMDTNAQCLAEMGSGMGTEVAIVDPVLKAGHPVSSSRIRNLILEARLEEAAELLGRPHRIKVGEGLGLPGDVATPPPGLYKVVLRGEGWTRSDTVEILQGRLGIQGECEGLKSLDFIHSVSREL
ncbi:MAG: FAD synthetase family protein [Spirochaetota bacterium]